MKPAIKHQRHPFLRSGLILLVLAVGAFGIAVINCRLTTASFSRDEIHGDVGLDLHLMTEAWSKIRSVYVDQTVVKPQALTYGAIQGMVDALGDTGHSHFLSPTSVKRERDFTEGKLEGIGAEVRMKNDQAVIVAPIDGSPARNEIG